MVLDVSLETRETGRGMNSRVSEKPTLARAMGLATGLDGWTAGPLGVAIFCGASSAGAGGGGVSSLGELPAVSGKA